MAYKLATRSSTVDLEKEIREFAKDTGLSLSAIYRKAHIIYLANNKKLNEGRSDEIRKSLS